MSPILRRALHWTGSALALLGIIFVALRLHDYGAELDFSRFDTAGGSVRYRRAGVSFAVSTERRSQ